MLLPMIAGFDVLLSSTINLILSPVICGVIYQDNCCVEGLRLLDSRHQMDVKQTTILRRISRDQEADTWQTSRFNQENKMR